jgi:flavorubredoxin
MAKELAKDLYYVGIKDYNRRMFDALVPLPQGTSYNSYLIKAEKSVLIDTVNPGFEQIWIGKVREIIDPSEITYLVMNHAEPDHAGSISYFLNLNRKTKLVTSPKGKELARRFYNVAEERIIVVKDGEEISLRNRKIKFILAPMLHWPETMFTYLEDEGVLFPCDFLGFHTAEGFYDSDIQNLEFEARRYYGEIMMPYSEFGKKVLEKIKNLKINLICPSHGPMHKNPERILGFYKKWTNGETEEKVLIVYMSMWKDIEKMVEGISGKLLEKEIKFSRYNLENSDPGDICAELVDSRAIIFGAPTVLASIHPLGMSGAFLVKVLRPPLKYALLLSSYGWAESAISEMKQVLSSLKNLELVGEFAVKGPAYEKDLKVLDGLVDKLIEKVKAKEPSGVKR